MAKTIVITGSSDGIGAAAARELHRKGHRVVVGRSAEKTTAIASDLGVDRFVADFARLDDVRKLAAGLTGTTKLYNILFTKELHRRYHRRGVSAAAFHPGVVATNFGAGSRSWWRHLYRLGSGLMTAPEKGAARLAWLAQSTPGRDWQSGTYYEKGKPAKKNNPQALDAALATELWVRSEALLDRETH